MSRARSPLLVTVPIFCDCGDRANDHLISYNNSRKFRIMAEYFLEYVSSKSEVGVLTGIEKKDQS